MTSFTRKQYPNAVIGAGSGGVRTPIALHCGTFNFNMAVRAAEFGRF